MMNKSTEALSLGNSVLEMEIQNSNISQKKKSKVQIVAHWDQTKTRAFAIFAVIFLVWAAVFFPFFLH
ncbi:unnamed protein product [Ceutorhynchus assimilis]|uniref:Uncharacterized protein n=1 Tax=Ceutorhynchus assimilis TaxID=467358 RepID=A0A9N9MJA5_9CUCU|nr:unnamed protein product [Ceutorhynchus assimilis]